VGGRPTEAGTARAVREAVAAHPGAPWLVSIALAGETGERDIALVTILSALPWIVGAPLVGVLVDRVDRRRAIMAGNGARCALIGALAVLVVTDDVRIWHVHLLSLSLPLFESMVDSAALPLIKRIVPDDRLETANSRLCTARILSEDVIGAPVAGLLLAAAATVPFFIDSATFLAAALLVMLVPGTAREESPDRGPGAPGQRSTSLTGQLPLEAALEFAGGGEGLEHELHGVAVGPRNHGVHWTPVGTAVIRSFDDRRPTRPGDAVGTDCCLPSVNTIPSGRNGHYRPVA
jgi:MFS family permease